MYEVARGRFTAWSSDGKDLFIYDSGSGTYDVVNVTTRPKVTFGSPVSLAFAALLPGRAVETAPRNWDISPLDNRVLGVVDPEEPEPQIRVVLNWLEELKQRVPVK
jgi:hypothetical protein